MDVDSDDYHERESDYGSERLPPLGPPPVRAAPAGRPPVEPRRDVEMEPPPPSPRAPLRVDEARGLVEDLQRIARQHGIAEAERSARHFLLVKNVADRSLHDHRLRQAMSELFVTYYLKGVADVHPQNEAAAEMATHPHHYQVLGVEIAPSEHQMDFPDDEPMPIPLRRLVHPNRIDPARVSAAESTYSDQRMSRVQLDQVMSDQLDVRILQALTQITQAGETPAENPAQAPAEEAETAPAQRRGSAFSRKLSDARRRRASASMGAEARAKEEASGRSAAASAADVRGRSTEVRFAPQQAEEEEEDARVAESQQASQFTREWPAASGAREMPPPQRLPPPDRGGGRPHKVAARPPPAAFSGLPLSGAPRVSTAPAYHTHGMTQLSNIDPRAPDRWAQAYQQQAGFQNTPAPARDLTQQAAGARRGGDPTGLPDSKRGFKGSGGSGSARLPAPPPAGSFCPAGAGLKAFVVFFQWEMASLAQGVQTFLPVWNLVDVCQVRKEASGDPEALRLLWKSSIRCAPASMLAGCFAFPISELRKERADQIKSDLEKMKQLGHLWKGFSEEVHGCVFFDQQVRQPKADPELIAACMYAHCIWDPGATSDMGSLASVLAVDQEVQRRSKGRLKGLWFQPSHPRKFRVANGHLAVAEYECEFRIPIYVRPGTCLVFRIAAVDMKPPEANPSFDQLLAAQVPWLFSNESGKKLGAVFSSRTGKIVSEDEILKGWTIHTVGSPSGHWLVPIVQAFLDLAFPLESIGQVKAVAPLPASLPFVTGVGMLREETDEGQCELTEGSAVAAMADPKEAFPGRFLKYLPNGPRDILIKIWGDDEIFVKRQRKAKIFPRKIPGAPEKYLRKLIVCEENGEILLDELGDMSQRESSHYGVISPGDGKVCTLVDRSGKLHLPSSTDSGSLAKEVNEKLGTKLEKESFVPVFSLPGRQYHMCQSVVPKADVSLGTRTPRVNRAFPSVYYLDAAKPWQDKDLTDPVEKLCSVFGQDLKAKLPAGTSCWCANPGCEAPMAHTPPVVENGENYDEFDCPEYGIEDVPAFFTYDNSQVWEMKVPNFEIGFGWEEPGILPIQWLLTYMTMEEIVEAIQTQAGVDRLHHQLWHLSADKLFERLSTVVQPHAHGELRKLCQNAVTRCKTCRQFMSPGHRPKSGGIWANLPGDIVAADTFFFTYKKKKYAIMHLVDLFSGYSVVHLCAKDVPHPEDVLAALGKYIERFGRAPVVFFTDQGGEFTDHTLAAYLNKNSSVHYFSPPQAPYTNGVNERHNGILKVWLSRIGTGSDAPMELLLQESVAVKNMTTKRHGFSASFLAFGYDPKAPLLVSVNDMTIPGGHLTAEMNHRIQLRQNAQKALSELKTQEFLKEALTKKIQSTDKNPLAKGQIVDYWVIPDGKTKSGYWEPNCVVIDMASQSSSKRVIIRRATGPVQEVARQRVRPQDTQNFLRFEALDPQKLPAHVQKLLDAEKAKETPSAKAIVHKFVDFFYSAGTRDSARSLASALRVCRQKKIEESDPAHRSDQTAQGTEADPEMCRTAAADATSSPPAQLHICKFCGQGFPTRREMFRHLEVCEAVPEERRHPSGQVPPHKGRPPDGSPKKKAVKAKTSPEKKKVKFDNLPTPKVEPAEIIPHEKRFVPKSEPPFTDKRVHNYGPTGPKGSSRLKEARQSRVDMFKLWKKREKEKGSRLPQEEGEDPDPWKRWYRTSEKKVLPDWGHRGPGGRGVSAKNRLGGARGPTSHSNIPPPLLGKRRNLLEEDEQKADDSPDEDEEEEDPPIASDGEAESPSPEAQYEYDSDAETAEYIDHLEDLIPQNFWVELDEKEDPVIYNWAQGASVSQLLLGTKAVDAWRKNYPNFHSFLAGQAPQAKVKAGKEVPRTTALEDRLFWKAMEAELDQLIKNGAKLAPPPTDSSWVYSSRWVFTYKEDGTRKARLVVRGFEEAWDPNAEDHATDSPTLNRDSFRIIAMTAAHRKWALQAWDIKTAFQQSDTRDDPDQTKSEREGLWIRLPKWIPASLKLPEGWLLKIAKDRTLYGMASAPRRFFFTLRKVMLQCGFVSSAADDCLFFLRNDKGELEGMAGWHVDDGLLTGTQKFWDAMEMVGKKLLFGSRKKDDFRFCGVRVRQFKDFSVKLDQAHMTDIDEIPVFRGRADTDPCTPKEITALRGVIGSLLYLTGLTRPFEAYAVSSIAAYVTTATALHLKMINTVVKNVKDNPEAGLFYPAGCACDCMYTFHDSNFKAERESGSQCGILTFLGPPVDGQGNIKGASLIRWTSRRARRVCHSTLAAETLAATAGLDAQGGMKFRLAEIGIYPKSVLLTDCRSLFDHVYAMTGKTAELLLPDVHELREASMPWRISLSDDYREGLVELWWCATHRMLADNLTKRLTPSTVEFMNVLQTGIIRLGEDYVRPRPTQQAHQFGVAEVSATQLGFSYLLTRLEFWEFSNEHLQEIGFSDSRLEPEFDWSANLVERVSTFF